MTASKQPEGVPPYSPVAGTKQSILIVEDESSIASFIGMYLKRAGFTVRVAGTGGDAIEKASADPPALIILDLMLPDLDGIDVCRRIRQRSDVPILMLSARDEDIDKIIGLEVGADDYLTKPFSPRELVARVRAVFRRIGTVQDRAEVIRVGDVTLDVPRMLAKVGKRTIELTSTEFELIATMMRQPGRVFTRGQLLDAIRGEQVESFERAVDAHVKNLRRKLEADPRNPRYVLTVYGVGYKFAEA
jgi:DNA-binding response OmpR family regulator